jgi:hypothetical protein
MAKPLTSSLGIFVHRAKYPQATIYFSNRAHPQATSMDAGRFPAQLG